MIERICLFSFEQVWPRGGVSPLGNVKGCIIRSLGLDRQNGNDGASMKFIISLLWFGMVLPLVLFSLTKLFDCEEEPWVELLGTGLKKIEFVIVNGIKRR